MDDKLEEGKEEGKIDSDRWLYRNDWKGMEEGLE